MDRAIVESRMGANAIGGVVSALAAMLLCLAFSAPTEAALNHSVVEKEFSAGPECSDVEDIAVVESVGLVYVTCRGPQTQTSIRKFNLNGQPVDFSAAVPYISGNEITGSPATPGGAVGTRIAVDNSPAHNGFIYVVTPSNRGNYESVDIFNPSGELIDTIPPVGAFSQIANDIDVGPDGSIYTIQDAFTFNPHVTKYDTSFNEVSRIYTLVSGTYVRVNSSGEVWTVIAGSGQPLVRRYDPDQFSNNLGITFGAPSSLVESVRAFPSKLFPDPLLKASNLRGIDVDPVNDDLYVNRENRIETFSAGTVEEAPHQNAPVFGSGPLTGSEAVEVTADRRVFASKGGGKILRFGPGDILPDLTTPRAAVDDVGHTSATVRASINPAGGPGIISCEIQYGKTASYNGEGSGVAPCSPDPSSGSFEEITDVSAELPGLITGTPYHYRFKAGNEKGTNVGIDRIVVPAFVLKVKTLPASQITDHSALLQGSYDPDGLETSFHFEFGVDTTYGASTAEVVEGEVPGAIAVEEELDNLPVGKVWHYRVVATNENGTTYGEDRTFKTVGPPDVSGLRATGVASTVATLNALIDPVGYGTTYRFEYGPTPAYGQQAPVSDGEISAGSGPTHAEQQIVDLVQGVTYHYRVVATNQWGTTISPDTTFDFAPPGCPNDHVRQQAISSYLPDCRAYELVSPASAGGVQLWPSQAAWDNFANGSIYGQGGRWALNTGRAMSPSRFAMFVSGGVINGLDAPNTALDMYVSSRTNDGWVTTLPGLSSAQASEVGRKECSEAMDLCLDHNEGDSEFAPYLFSVNGVLLGQLPSNVKTIPGGTHFTGAQRMSGDFNHFFFSATDVVFAPGGLSGSLGSAYDNDLSDHTVQIASKLPNGADIPIDSPVSHAIEFPGLSPDGSHVLMQTPATNGQFHLYLRVNQSLTYDIAQGAGVTLVGMSRDGSRVLFTSAQQLIDDDNDESTDLFMWSEQGDSLIRVSKGNGNGDVDECNASWIDGCGIAQLSTQRGNPGGNPSVPGLDDVIAEGSGDVYFYSPEQLDPAKPGIPNQRNLYLYRNGAVQLVASFDPKTQVDRMQISPNGLYAAMVTDSRLTSYDNKGLAEMYTYDAGSGVIRCASCDPSGLPPSADVIASQGGRFMSDDGRAFFASKDSLVPRDTNGSITDVYEYVGGRPQLISSGFASRDFTGGGLSSLLGNGAEYTGLEGVSRSGADVYFSTFDTLVPQDRNGQRVKFYDARTGGGFAPPPSLPPCAAADECHGTDSSPPVAPAIGTIGRLGAGGNVASTPPTKKAKAKKQRKSTKKNRRRHRRQRHG